MSYLPIEDYGIIGDMHSAALIGRNGSIDWLCFPHFDSPSIFAALLDHQIGGRFSISPTLNGVRTKQHYWPDTNILVTRFLSPDGIGEIKDFMPVGVPPTGHGYHRLIRQVSTVRGSMDFNLICQPAFNYARDPHQVRIGPSGACFLSPNLCLQLGTTVPLTQDGTGVVGSFTLEEDQSVVFELQELERGSTECGPAPNVTEADALFQDTASYWQKWLSGCTYTGRWREMVHRSALALKLLTYQTSGAIVAAPTAGLPEVVGGERNWDYRYSWLRDAAFTVYALLRVGFTQEAAAFMQWIEERCREDGHDGSLQPLYAISGQSVPHEEVLDHLEGYRGSRPVRIGNRARDQLQLDIYGELLDAVYLHNKYGTPISYDLWTHLRVLINYVCDNWHLPDDGIWEVRSGRQQFTYSKLMCWVALDRALRLADKRSFPADRDRWLKVRDEIYEDIMRRGWNQKLRSFVQVYDSDILDASALIMPLVYFVAPTDPRMLRTIDAINSPPRNGGLVSNSLVYRYGDNAEDGLSGNEGAFSMCTFWLVEALTRAGQSDPSRLHEARRMFEQMLSYANHLGLYAEEIGPSGEALGNFPQAFTHLSLISAAFNLDRTLGPPTPARPA